MSPWAKILLFQLEIRYTGEQSGLQSIAAAQGASDVQIRQTADVSVMLIKYEVQTQLSSKGKLAYLHYCQRDGNNLHQLEICRHFVKIQVFLLFLSCIFNCLIDASRNWAPGVSKSGISSPF